MISYQGNQMESFIFAINAVLPLLLLVVLGYLLKKIKLFSEDFLAKGNKFCFYVALPVLLFKNIYDSTFDNIDWKLILFVVVAIICVFIIGLLMVMLFCHERDKKGVILQAVFRSNFAYIGIPLATSLFASGSLEAKETLAYVSLISMFAIPLFNILAVVSLTLFQNEKKIDFKKTFLGIVRNPLIIGTMVGILFIAFRTLVPNAAFFVRDQLSFLYKVVTNIASIASPLALIVLGGQFEFKATKELWKYILPTSIFRIVIVPLAILTIAVSLDIFNSAKIAALLALYASPVAVASAIMAKEMNNDHILAGQIVVWTTLASSITIFLFIFVFRLLGYL